jgi:hypothetical protein
VRLLLPKDSEKLFPALFADSFKYMARIAFALLCLHRAFFPRPALFTAQPSARIDPKLHKCAMLPIDEQTWLDRPAEYEDEDEDDEGESLFRASPDIKVAFTAFPGFLLDSNVCKCDVVLL